MRKRQTFKDTREITPNEQKVIDKLYQYPNTMNEGLLVAMTSTLFNTFTERDIREIVGMWNKRKFINCDNTVKFHKHNGSYHKIVKGSNGTKYELYKKKWNMIVALQDYKIYLEDFGAFEDNHNAMQIDMMSKLLKEVNDES